MVTKADASSFIIELQYFSNTRVLHMRHLGGPAAALRGPPAATPTRGDAGDGRGERPRRPPGADLAGAPHSSRRRPPGGHLASCRSGALPSLPSRRRGHEPRADRRRSPPPPPHKAAPRAPGAWVRPSQWDAAAPRRPHAASPRARAGRDRTKGLLCGRPPARRGADPEPAPPPRAHGGTRGPERGPHPRCAASRRLRRAGSGEDTAPARRAHAAAREGGAGRGGGVHGRTAGPEAGQPWDAAPLRGFNCIYAEGELPVLEPRCTAPWPAEISPLGKVRAESRWPREAFPKRLSPDREQLRDFPLNQHFPFKTEEQLLESSQPPLIAARSLNMPGLWAAR